MSSYIRTYTGEYVNLEDPQIDTINLMDIAHALANIGRFTGHTEEFYSVAQHSVLAADMAERMYGVEEAKALLFHDAHEAYLGDVASPLKRLIIDRYARLARKFDTVLMYKFDYAKFPEAVATIDRRMGLTEAEQLMRADLDNGFWPPGETFDIRIYPWTPEEAEKVFHLVFLDIVKRSRYV
jgi:hypothetical protein